MAPFILFIYLFFMGEGLDSSIYGNGRTLEEGIGSYLGEFSIELHLK